MAIAVPIAIELAEAFIAALEAAAPIVGAVAVGGATGVALEKASETFQKQPTLAVQDCPANTEEITLPCFKAPEGADAKEFSDQLEEQANEINQTDPKELEKRIENYDKNNRDPSAQRAERDNYRNRETERLIDDYIEQGKTAQEANELASAEVEAEMATLDATHALDMIAGGDPSKISGLGDSSVNRSIGSQWRSRVKKLLEAIKKKINTPPDGKKIKIKLVPC